MDLVREALKLGLVFDFTTPLGIARPTPGPGRLQSFAYLFSQKILSFLCDKVTSTLPVSAGSYNHRAEFLALTRTTALTSLTGGSWVFRTSWIFFAGRGGQKEVNDTEERKERCFCADQETIGD